MVYGDFVQFEQESGETNIVPLYEITRVKKNADGKVSLKIGDKWLGVVEKFEDYQRFFAPIHICDFCDDHNIPEDINTLPNGLVELPK